MVNPEVTDLLQFLIMRQPMLEYLYRDNCDKRDLENKLDLSRPTVDRAFRNLEEYDIISSSGTDYEMTTFGKLIYNEIADAHDSVEALIDSKSLLHHLPRNTEIPPRIYLEGNVIESSSKAPVEPFEKVRSWIEDSYSFVSLIPVLNPEYLRLIHEAIIKMGLTGEVFLEEELVEGLSGRYETMINELMDSDDCSVLGINDSGELAMILIDDSKMWIGIYGEAGGFVGALTTEADYAIEWAQTMFDPYRDIGEHIW